MAPRSQSSSAVVLAAVVALVVTGLVVDATAIGTRELGPAAVEVPLLAGSSTCAAMDLGDASAVTATTVVAPREQDATATGGAGGDEAVAELRLEDDGEVRSLASPATDGGAVATAVAGDGGPVALAARWEGAPLLLSRRWSIDSTDRVPGTVEGPCPAEPSQRWVVPGVATAGGAAARLYLANPTDGPASLAVTFTTPDGPVAPTRLANLAVGAHDQVTVDLNQFVPEEPDLGVVVTTRAGLVVAEVLQTLEAAVGGVDGRSLVPARAEAREVWTIPWLASGDQETAWIWVTNPGEEATDVRLVLQTESGPVVPPDSGVTLPPGTTKRIDLRGALGEVGSAAVTVRSAPGVPIFASGAVLRAVEDDAVRGGIAVVEGLPASGGLHGALTAVGASGRERFLSIANPGDQDATVDVTVVGRSAVAARSVATGLVVPAGSSVRVELGEHTPLEGGFAVLVDAVEGVVAATVVAQDVEGPLNLTAVAARAFPTSVLVTERPVQRDRSLLHPIDRDRLVDVEPARDRQGPTGTGPTPLPTGPDQPSEAVVP